ncbi:MAG: small subunit ribosomal protein S1 [Saprospiraceae bacterium]|jgi:small subunit ribosomal protein S1
MLDDKDPVQDENKAENAETSTETQEVETTTIVEKVADATKVVVETIVEKVVDVKDAVVESLAEDTEEEPVKEEEQRPEDMRGPHDDYDWSISNINTQAYSDEEIAKYLSDYEQTLGNVQENSVVSGIVTAIHSGDVVLDINYKSDGLVSFSEFRDMPDLAIGDHVDVYVEDKEDHRGQLVLSRRKAKLIKAWEMLVDSYENGTIIKGTVVSKTKGGLIVDCSGLETFLPGSQIDIKPIIDYDAYVNKTMEFKVVKINETIKNAVVSHKALIESDLAEQREHIISSLEKGQVLEGTVKNITDFGAFMDLGGVDGLLYITDISWGRINHPNEILELNQKVNVVVLDFDENKKRISLGLKQLQPHPWQTLGEDIAEGSTVKGKIVNIEDYGAFLEIIPGVEGLIHVSEVTWSNQPVNARDYFSLGKEIEAKVVTIDRDERKMSLSIKQLSNDPWSSIGDQFPVGQKFSGVVKNLTPYGVFVELEEGIGGMVHISDLSWTKRYSHPSEFTKVGETIDIQILEIDQDSRKLSLGHKQLEENPWDTFENVFPIGSYHEATLIKKDDRGGIVQLPYGLEAYAPLRHLKKEDNTSVEVDETTTFKVIEFNRDDKRILVSHLRYVEDIKREADDTVRTEQREERKTVQKAVKKTQSNVERATFGDLDVFSQLKDQLAADAPKPPAPKAKAAPVKEAAPAKKEAKVEAPAKEEATAKEEVKTDAPEKEEAKVDAPAKEKAKAAPKAKKAKADSEEDDFKKIEGIGPKISELLKAADILTFEALSTTDSEKIKEILAEAGNRYKSHDPTTWPAQAKMAAKGDWDGLKKWQDELDGGK